MTEPAKRSPDRKSRRWLRWIIYVAGSIVAIPVILATAGLIYETIESFRTRHLYPPPGRLIDVGGYRMHLDCTGEGSPTVILESGLGDYSLGWHKVQPSVAQFTRVCSYDRAGLGWSDSSPKPRTTRVFVEEMHTLLQNAQVSPPFVLVGHSSGGVDVQVYARSYPSETVGMVLLDSGHPDAERRMPPEFKKAISDFTENLRPLEYVEPFGIPRLMGWCGGGPPDIQCKERIIHEIVVEASNIWANTAQAQPLQSLGDFPLVVLSRDPDNLTDILPPGTEVHGGESQARLLAKTINQANDQMQRDLTRLSSNSSRVIAKGSGHEIQEQRPDLVIESIRKVVEECRSDRRPDDHNFSEFSTQGLRQPRPWVREGLRQAPVGARSGATTTTSTSYGIAGGPVQKAMAGFGVAETRK